MRRRLLIAIALALVVPVAGCGGSGSEAGPTASPSATPTPSESPSASSSPTPTPSPSPSPTAGPTPSPSPAPPADLADLLLPAADLPGLTDTWSWSEGSTGTTSQRIGACSRLGMESLGAERSVVRRYLPTGDEAGSGTSGSAVHEVSQFVDEKSVRQARAIFSTWHDQCAARIPGATIGPVTDVITPAGFGTWYLVTQRVAGTDRSRYRMLGILTSGTTVELIEMVRTARTFGYAPRNEPVVGAVDAAAERLP